MYSTRKLISQIHQSSLHLGAERALPLWDTDRSRHTLNYWELLKQRMQLGQSERFERQPRAAARLIDKGHALNKITPSIVGEVAVLSNT